MAIISGLSINIEVLEKMAAMAALETSGVAGLVPKKIAVANAVSLKPVLKTVHAEVKNGAVQINIYISIYKGNNAKEVAEATQESVKEKVQSMTGSAVTKVNVFVMDTAEPQEEE